MERQVDISTLPTQTEAAFGLILFVFLGTLVAALVGSSPIYMPPIVLSMLILPARAILTIPDRELRLRDEPATQTLQTNGTFEYLQQTITQLAAEMGYTKPIQLIISRNHWEARASGSWRRHYILLGHEIAQKIGDDLKNPNKKEKAMALLLHEIGHIVHRDVQRVGYTRELLRSCATLLPWWAIFLSVWLGIGFQAGEALLDFDIKTLQDVDPVLKFILAPIITLPEAERIEISHKLQTISFSLLTNFILNAFLPIMLVGFILWQLYWRRMVRMQEHHADYLASRRVGWITLAGAMMRYSGQFEPVSSQHERLVPIIIRQRLKGLVRPLEVARKTAALNRAFQLQTVVNIPLRERWQQWRALHPNFYARRDFVRDPLAYYRAWKAPAWSAALLALALDLTLTSPLIGYHISGYPVHVSTLAILVLTTTWWLPLLILKEPYKPQLRRFLVVVFGLRWGWLVFNTLWLLLMIVLLPEVALSFLNDMAFAGSRTAGIPQSLPVTDPLGLALSVLPGFFGLQLLQLAIVLVLLVIYRATVQRLLRRQETNWKQIHWILVIGLGVVAITWLLTPASDLLILNSGELTKPGHLLGYGIGGLALMGTWLALHPITRKPGGST